MGRCEEVGLGRQRRRPSSIARTTAPVVVMLLFSFLQIAVQSSRTHHREIVEDVVKRQQQPAAPPSRIFVFPVGYTANLSLREGWEHLHLVACLSGLVNREGDTPVHRLKAWLNALVSE